MAKSSSKSAACLPCSPKYLAELIGTFALTLLVSLSLVNGSGLTPFVAATTLAIFVYTIGPISGCQINPAVTIGLWSIKKVSGIDAFWYIVAQIIGAVLAMALSTSLTGLSPELTIVDSGPVMIAELVGAAFLVFGIAAVVHGKVSDGAAGVTIGGSLLLGILVASTVSNGVLNPAVALGIGSISVMYVVGPLLGGIVGAWLYRWIAS